MAEEPQGKETVSIILCAESADEVKVLRSGDLSGRLVVPAMVLKHYCHMRL